jgi:hypothetical protein
MKDLYIMIVQVNTPVSDLVVNKNTGGVFNKCVISSSMTKDYIPVQDYINRLQSWKGWPLGTGRR